MFRACLSSAGSAYEEGNAKMRRLAAAAAVVVAGCVLASVVVAFLWCMDRITRDITHQRMDGTSDCAPSSGNYNSWPKMIRRSLALNHPSSYSSHSSRSSHSSHSSRSSRSSHSSHSSHSSRSSRSSRNNDNDGRLGLHVRNVRRIRGLLRRIQGTDATVTAVVFGSSMTLGVGVGGPDYAWPSLLARKLTTTTNTTTTTINTNRKVTTSRNLSFAVFNKAKGGSTSVWALLRLDSLLMSGVDLVIVDYDVTDCYAISDTEDDQAYHAAVTELLVRRLLVHSHFQPAVLFMHVAVTNSGSWNALDRTRQRCYHLMDTVRVDTLRAYGVPIVSQRMAMWEDFSCPLSTHWPCSSGCNHPGPPAHELLARLVAAFLANATFYGDEDEGNVDSLASSSPVYFNDAARALDDQFCRRLQTGIDGQGSVRMAGVTPLTSNTEPIRVFSLPSANEPLRMYAIQDVRLGLNATYTSCWRHREDITGKPGLIADNCHSTDRTSVGDSIIFPVTYGASPRLLVTFLRTYTNDTGVVHISFVPFTRKEARVGAQLGSLPWKRLATLDPLRVSDDGYSRASLTWTNVYAPKRANYTASRDKKYAELSSVPDAFLPHASYLIRVQQVDANAAAQHSPRHRLRASHQKFKLYFVSFC